jgi:hypothetical protein
MNATLKRIADNLVCPLSYDHFTDPFISADRILQNTITIITFCLQSSYFDSRLQLNHIVQSGGCSTRMIRDLPLACECSAITGLFIGELSTVVLVGIKK